MIAHKVRKPGRCADAVWAARSLSSSDGVGYGASMTEIRGPLPSTHTRRGFLGLVAATGVAAAVAGGCGRPGDGSQPATSGASTSGASTSGQDSVTLTGHRTNVKCTFNPDGKILATSSPDGMIRLWDVATRQTIRLLSRPDVTLSDVAFSPDGKILASGGVGDALRLWDVVTGQTIRTFPGSGTNDVGSVMFSPDGKTLATAQVGSPTAHVLQRDVATGETIHTFIGHNDPAMSLAFSPDGKLLATGSLDKTVRLWDVATGQTTRVLTGHAEGVVSVAFSPADKILASGSGDKTARLWPLS